MNKIDEEMETIEKKLIQQKMCSLFYLNNQIGWVNLKEQLEMEDEWDIHMLWDLKVHKAWDQEVGTGAFLGRPSSMAPQMASSMARSSCAKWLKNETLCTTSSKRRLWWIFNIIKF